MLKQICCFPWKYNFLSLFRSGSNNIWMDVHSDLLLNEFISPAKLLALLAMKDNISTAAV